MAILTVHVMEVGMAAPDVVCMIIRDQEPEIGALLQLSSPDSGTYGSIVQRDPVTGGAGSDYCQIVGQLNGVQKMFLKFSDKKPIIFMDKAAVENPSKWSTIGGLTVTNVYHKARVFGQINGFGTGNGLYSTMEHYVYLKLSGNLAQGGPYTISITGNTFPPYAFTFNDRVSRSNSIRSVQTAYRASEKNKFAYLSAWIPGYGTEGRVDFAGTYSLTTAELIDDQGVTVYTGNLAKTTSGVETEKTTMSLSAALIAGNSFSGTINGINVGPVVFTTSAANTMSLIAAAFIAVVPTCGARVNSTQILFDFAELTNCAVTLGASQPIITLGQLTGVYPNYLCASTTIAPKLVTAVTNNGVLTTFTSVGHGFTSGQTKLFTGFGNTTNSNLNVIGMYVITRVDNDTFTIPLATISGTYKAGVFLPGFDSLVYETHFKNAWGTNVYKFDFSAFDAATYQGVHRVRIAGLGVSDAFTLMEHSRYNDAQTYMKGYYNDMNGMALSSSVGGYTRAAPFADGVNGHEVYESLCPSAFNDEAFCVDPSIPSALGCCSSFSLDTNLITGNVVNGNVNGVAFGPITFATNHNATMTAITTAITAAIPGIGCVAANSANGTSGVAGNRSIYLFHLIGGGIALSTLFTVTGLTVTGGASQPNKVISPFRTANRVAFGPTIRDAGDWDWHLPWDGSGSDPLSAHDLLELGYRHLPATKRDLHLGFPKASALDPTLYAGTDNMGDQFHMAIYTADALYRTQKVDGRVYGGMNYAFATAGSGDKGGGYNQTEPSQYSPYTGVLLAADPQSNYMYSCIAAKIAQVLNEAGFTTAGSAWRASAILAWNWADPIYQDFKSNGAAGSLVNGYFNGTLGLQSIGITNTGKFMSDSATWTTQMAEMFGPAADTTRLMAAGGLYSLTGSSTYGDICNAATTATRDKTGYALWEFTAARPAFGNTVTDVTSGAYATKAAAQLAAVANAPLSTSTTYWQEIARSTIANPQNQDNIYAKQLQDILNYNHGVNQEDRTRVTGYGNRQPQNSLIRDREGLGIPASSVPGIGVYMHAGGQPTYMGPFANGDTDSSTNYTCLRPTGVDPLWWGKTVLPNAYQRPAEESFNDNTYAVGHTEFTSGDTAKYFIMSAILHCFDGNAATAPIIGKYKRRLTCTA